MENTPETVNIGCLCEGEAGEDFLIFFLKYTSRFFGSFKRTHITFT
jgi:hypothetical protein